MSTIILYLLLQVSLGSDYNASADTHITQANCTETVGDWDEE